MKDQTNTHQLTKNQALVFDALLDAKTPMSAYAILDVLRPHGFRAPLQVYRALEKLNAFDLVHKLESRNAFVACQHQGGCGHNAVAFAICDSCDQVNEITAPKLDKQLSAIAESADFEVAKSTIELRGTCDACNGDTNKD